CVRRELCQPLQQCLGLLEIQSVKPLSEPAVDVCAQVSCLSSLALLPPQPTQAQRRPQLQRLGPLTSSDVEGSLEAGFSFHLEGRPAARLPPPAPARRVGRHE